MLTLIPAILNFRFLILFSTLILSLSGLGHAQNSGKPQLSWSDQEKLIGLIQQSIQTGSPLDKSVMNAIRNRQLNLERHGGSTGSGGGWGFLNDRTGQLVLLDLEEALEASRYYRQIDAVKKFVGFEKPNPGENAQQFLMRILNEKLGQVAPFFSRRVQEAFYYIQMDQPQWTNEMVPDSQDLEKIRASKSGRRLVQVAMRYSVSFPGMPPRGFVDVNRDLFQKMDITHQAALLLHESMYILNSSLGHKSSLKTRDFVGYVMSKFEYTIQHIEVLLATTGAYRMNDVMKRDFRATVINTYMQKMGVYDILKLFLPVNVRHATPSSLSRQAAYLGAYNEQPPALTNTDEEDFMFLALRFVGIPESQQMFMGGSQEWAALVDGCRKIQKLPQTIHEDDMAKVIVERRPQMIEKSINYCKRIGALR